MAQAAGSAGFSEQGATFLSLVLKGQGGQSRRVECIGQRRGSPGGRGKAGGQVRGTGRASRLAKDNRGARDEARASVGAEMPTPESFQVHVGLGDELGFAQAELLERTAGTTCDPRRHRTAR